MSTAIDIHQKAANVIADLASADKEQALAVLAAEQQKGDAARSTVVKAAEDRLALLDLPGEPQDEEPTGVWAQLLDDQGEPVLRDGKPVATDLLV